MAQKLGIPATKRNWTTEDKRRYHENKEWVIGWGNPKTILDSADDRDQGGGPLSEAENGAESEGDNSLCKPASDNGSMRPGPSIEEGSSSSTPAANSSRDDQQHKPIPVASPPASFPSRTKVLHLRSPNQKARRWPTQESH